MYAKINNGVVEKFPYSIGLLRKDNPKTSFPNKLTEAILTSYGVYPVREINPTVGRDEKLVKSWVPEFIGGNWQLNHQAVAMSSEEIAVRDEVLANGVREKRSNLLADSDWRVIKSQETGVAMSPEWVSYRLALRDITSHPNFPHLKEEDWPVSPG